MSTSARPILLVAFGTVLVHLAGGSALLAYVRPQNRPFVLTAGLAIALVAVASVAAGRNDTTTRCRIGWLVLAPVTVLAVVTPPADGALVGALRTGPPGRPAGGLAPLRGPDPITLTVSQLVVRSVWAARTLRGHRIRVVGFVAAAHPSGFDLARLSITCCAADAQEDIVSVRTDERAPPQGHWTSVIGTVAPPHGTSNVPVLHALTVSPADPPADPYD